MSDTAAIQQQKVMLVMILAARGADTLTSSETRKDWSSGSVDVCATHTERRNIEKHKISRTFYAWPAEVLLLAFALKRLSIPLPALFRFAQHHQLLSLHLPRRSYCWINTCAASKLQGMVAPV